VALQVLPLSLMLSCTFLLSELRTVANHDLPFDICIVTTFDFPCSSTCGATSWPAQQNLASEIEAHSLIGTLHTVNLNPPSARHTCLSYPWGDPPPIRTITVHGFNFPIRKNFFGFPKSASPKGLLQKRFFWINHLYNNHGDNANASAEYLRSYRSWATFKVWLQK
jgi:hypothetical protein